MLQCHLYVSIHSQSFYVVLSPWSANGMEQCTHALSFPLSPFLEKKLQNVCGRLWIFESAESVNDIGFAAEQLAWSEFGKANSVDLGPLPPLSEEDPRTKPPRWMTGRLQVTQKDYEKVIKAGIVNGWEKALAAAKNKQE